MALDDELIAELDRRAGPRRREFAERGVTLQQVDCLTAAAALSVDAALATANTADFPMPEIVVEDRPVGE
jgi:predicted nucleic acid-binding protein